MFTETELAKIELVLGELFDREKFKRSLIETQEIINIESKVTAPINWDLFLKKIEKLIKLRKTESEDSEWGRNIDHLLSHINEPDVINCLLDNADYFRVQIKQSSFNRVSACLNAALVGAVETAKILFDEEYNPKVNEYIIGYAVCSGHTEWIMDLITRWKVDITDPKYCFYIFTNRFQNNKLMDIYYRELSQSKGWNNLFVAIYHGDFNKVKMIVREDRHAIKHRDPLGRNAFLQAAACGREEIFYWFRSPEAMELKLDEEEISLDVRDAKGFTPFLVAVDEREFDFIKRVIKKYPDRDFLKERDKEGRDAIQIADFCRYSEISTFLRGIKRMANNPLLQARTREHPLRESFRVTPSPDIPPEDLALMKAEKWNSLFIAIYRGDLTKVKKVLKTDRLALRHRDRLGMNAFLMAAVYGRQEIFNWFTSPEAAELKLDEKEVNLDVHDAEGFTPFLAAVYGGQLGFIKNLIKKYPDRDFLTEKDQFGRNGIEVAKFYEHALIIDFLGGLASKKRDGSVEHPVFSPILSAKEKETEVESKVMLEFKPMRVGPEFKRGS